MSPIDNPAEFPGETDTPYPPRYRWLKCSICIFTLGCCVSIVLYIGWTRYADRRLQTQIDRNIADGDVFLYSTLDSSQTLDQAMPTPIADLGLAQTLEDEDQVTFAIAEPNYPRALARLPPHRDMFQYGPVYGLVHRNQMMFIWPPIDYVQQQYRDLADHRSAVIAEAIRQYRSDHADHWPTTLSKLVPAYLLAIPLDPFSPTDAPFKYKPDAHGGPFIYSVGLNGIDDGGSELPDAGLPPGRWDKLDTVFHLTPRPPPATAP